MKKLSTLTPVLGGLALAFAAGLCGCSTPEVNLDPELSTFSREMLEDMDEIRCPPNYNVENFKKLQLGVAFDAVPRAKDGAAGGGAGPGRPGPG